MINTVNSARYGIEQAQNKVAKAADSISRFGQEEGSDTDFPKDVVDLKVGKAAHEANIAVIKTDDEMKKAVLDIIV